MSERRSIIDILRLNADLNEDWEVIKREYVPVDIDKVVIDGDTFQNYGQFQFVWEKSFKEEPKRAGDGSLLNLNGYAVIILPHLVINFSIMSIDDYRAIVRKDLAKNEFTVECYDPVHNTKIKKKMYFHTLDMPKFHILNKVRFNGESWEEFLELAGVQDYTIEMVGTKSDLDLVSVVYHLNPPADTGRNDETIGEMDVYSGEEIVIGGATDFQDETFGGKYRFTKWNLSPSGGNLGNYIDGNAYTINADTILYAQWQASTSHILSYNYGLADPAINESENVYVTNKLVAKGESIGALPVAELPFVVEDDVKYYPYAGGKWYKTPIRGANSTPLEDNTPYWLDRDSTIYLLYETRSYWLRLYVDGELYQSNAVEYNTAMNLPQLVKIGYTFDGWYSTEDFKEGTKVSGNMKPYDLRLYARWVQNK